jgi:hypothetical protein
MAPSQPTRSKAKKDTKQTAGDTQSERGSQASTKEIELEEQLAKLSHRFQSFEDSLERIATRINTPSQSRTPSPIPVPSTIPNRSIYDAVRVPSQIPQCNKLKGRLDYCT